MLNPAKLRHRVIIQRPVETQDTQTGDMVVNWENLATVWAEIAPLSAKDLISAQQEQSKVTDRITIRYRQDISHEMRIIHQYKNKIYLIEGLLSDKDSGLEYLTIPVSEGVRFKDVNSPFPVILEEPQIIGDVEAGLRVDAYVGLWANEPTSYKYKWYVDGLPVNGANSNFLIVPNEVGKILTLGIIADNDGGNSIEAISDNYIIQ